MQNIVLLYECLLRSIGYTI